jgi:hypothetical protein
MLKNKNKLTADQQLDILSKDLARVGLGLDIVGRRVLKTVNVSLSLPPNRSTGTIRIHHGKDADFDITMVGGSKEHRQAVIKISERKRVIKQKLDSTRYDLRKEKIDYWIGQSRVSLPPSAEYSLEYLEREENTSANTWNAWNDKTWLHSVELTATVPSSRVYLLVGFDEEDTFISMLPRAADSVEAAHDLLMPNEVKKAIKQGRDVMRSGEFFLVEITEHEDAEITSALSQAIDHKRQSKVRTNVRSHLFNFTDKTGLSSTDHVPLLSVHADDKTFVTGGIGNKRHKLIFDGWYRMVRNTEIEPPANTRNWD